MELSRITLECWCVGSLFIIAETVWSGVRLDLISRKHLILRKCESGEEVGGRNCQFLNLSYETACCKISRVWTWRMKTLTRVSPLCWRPKCQSPEYPRSHLCSRSACKKKPSSTWHSILAKSTPAEQIKATSKTISHFPSGNSGLCLFSKYIC